MKSTGIIRRIDELGRVVVPKEIRKNLKIHEGDTLEIFVENQSIVLKKFSQLDNLKSTADKIVFIVSRILKKCVLVVDLDHVLACTKTLEDSYLNRSLSFECVEIIMERKEIYQHDIFKFSFVESEFLDCSYIICPILVDSDVIGAVILFDSQPLTESDFLIGKMLSAFFVKNIEE